MTDNLEQLEKDWPQRSTEDISQSNASPILFLSSIVFSLNLLLHSWIITKQAKHHSVHLWYVTELGPALAVLFVWLGFLLTYRRVKANLRKAGASEELGRSIRFFGLLLLMLMFVALSFAAHVMDFWTFGSSY